jgi:hypothetical protein
MGESRRLFGGGTFNIKLSFAFFGPLAQPDQAGFAVRNVFGPIRAALLFREMRVQ